jgi:type I restriction enzyme S subunit
MVPEGWILKELNDLALIERGRFSARPRNDPSYFGGNYPFVQTGDIASAGTYLKSHSQSLNDRGLSVSKLFPKNTILITIAANIGETAITTYSVACPDSVVAIQPYTQLADTFWLKKVLETKKKDLDAKATQNAQKNINLQVLMPLVIATPPLSEQKKIAKILSTWDLAITTTEHLLHKSHQQKKALSQQLLIGKRRIPGFDQNWKSFRLGQLFSRVTTKNNKTSTNVVTISAQHGLVRQEDYFKKTVASEILDNYFLLNKGQFVYNKSYSNGYPMGAIKRLNKYESGVVTTLYICFDVSDKGICHPEFFEHYFEEGLLNNGLRRVANEGGRAHGLLNVKPSDFFGLNVLVPCVKEQKKIALTLSTADREIATLKQKLACLKQEKKALMQQLLTGKRRVQVPEMEIA